MKLKTIGLITYHYPHLKTEQVMQRLLGDGRDFKYKIYALPFTPRETRETLIQHRPDQTKGAEPQVMAEKHRIPYIKCSADSDIDDSCDIYLVLGAGILSAGCVEGKRIINCHPGIIPASRGLDSFKWAIYDMKPLGITLHYIDARVDAGEIVSVVPTNVYKSDSISTLARRHYENEIDTLSRFTYYLKHPQHLLLNIAEDEPKRRMSNEQEEELTRRFSAYRNKYGIDAKNLQF